MQILFCKFNQINENLSLTECINIIEQISNFGTGKITFVGGEPTLVSFLPELVIRAKSLKNMSTQICEVILEKISEDKLFSLLKKSERNRNMFLVISTLLRKHSHTMKYLLEWALLQDNSNVYENIRIYLQDDYIDEKIDENLLKTFYKREAKNRG